MKKLVCEKSQKVITNKVLCLQNTLVNGQAFNWFPQGEKMNEFRGIFRKYVIDLQQNEQGEIEYTCFPKEDQMNTILNQYFQFQVPLEDHIARWRKVDKHFNSVSEHINGLRIINQDPFECLISFMCSQNNNIPRITKILASLRQNFGQKLDFSEGSTYYTFPTCQELSEANETQLRDLGLGYRAKYLVDSVKQILDKGGEEYLIQLRGKSHDQIREELTSFNGIGNKVADCIALFSLKSKNSIPVDTHVWQIYQNHYGGSQQKDEKVSPKNYLVISEFFQKKFGDYAGWAHSFLFTADLSSFKKEINTQNDAEKQVKKGAEKSQIEEIKKQQPADSDQNQTQTPNQQTAQKQPIQNKKPVPESDSEPESEAVSDGDDYTPIKANKKKLQKR